MSTKIYGQGCLVLPIFNPETGHWEVIVPGEFIDAVVCRGTHEECHVFINTVRKQEKTLKNTKQMDNLIKTLKVEQRALQLKLQEVSRELTKAELEATKTAWGQRLVDVERGIQEMIDRLEITPYMGGKGTSAYMAILKRVAEDCFDFRLIEGDVLKVLEKFLPEMEGYHKEIDPTL